MFDDDGVRDLKIRSKVLVHAFKTSCKIIATSTTLASKSTTTITIATTLAARTLASQIKAEML